jgi:hypothetical protein
MHTKFSSKRGRHWEIADLTDFEYLLANEIGDSEESNASAADKRFQSEKLPALKAAGDLSRRAVFRSWLDSRREFEAAQLPGQYLKTAWRLMVLASGVLGAMLGGSLTAALLYYHGEVPVNVPWFLACTLGVQFIVLFAAAVIWLLRRTMGTFDHSLLQTALQKLIVSWLPGEQRERLKAVFARILRRHEIYRALEVWPVLMITQIFGVWFNLGILTVLLANISFKDIEFGWQSSFVKSDDAAYQIASAVATPWKWFAPQAHPTLAEVAESHFQYREGHSNKSWWPFLCYSITCYGLLVRGLLLVIVAIKWRRSMRRLSFEHEGCASLYRRLVGPIVRTQCETATLEIPVTIPSEGHRAESGSAMAMIANDFDLDPGIVARYIHDKYGWKLANCVEVQVDYPGGNAAALASLAELAANLVSVVIVLPAERPPIKGIAFFVDKVANAAGTKPELLLLLVGRKQENGFSPVDEQNFTYWRNFVAINRLKVSLERWSAP